MTCTTDIVYNIPLMVIPEQYIFVCIVNLVMKEKTTCTLKGMCTTKFNVWGGPGNSIPPGGGRGEGV